MKTLHIITARFSLLFTLALAVPPLLQQAQVGNQVILLVNNYIFHADVPEGGWGKASCIRGVVLNASVLHAEKYIECFLWGQQDGRNSRSDETEIGDNIGDTYISSFFTNKQRYIPELQGSQSRLPFSEAFCYNASPFGNSNLAVLLLERPRPHTNENENNYPNTDSNLREGDGELVLMSLDPSGEVIHQLEYQSGQIPHVTKAMLIDVPNPIIECSVIGRDGEELVSRSGEPSKRRLIRDATRVHCKPKREDSQ